MENKHFFQPLLPGFHSHVTIPVAFFLKYIDGRIKQTKAKLRSDASKITWEVKVDGDRLTDGWKEFALAHDLRIGDIVVFRQDKDMDFHLTHLGPSCCEIQYGSCLDDENNLEKNPKKKNPRRKAESSSLDPSCFVAYVSPATLRYDTLNLPRSFARANGLDIKCGEIVLMNAKGRSWTLDLKGKKSRGTVYIRSGWRSFCNANGLKAGGFFTFKLIQRGKTPVLRLSPREPEEQEKEEECSEGDEIESLFSEQESDEENNLGENQRNKKVKKNPRRETEPSPLDDPSCFVANVLASTLRYDALYFPRSFVRENGLDTGCGEIVLMNEKGTSWTLALKQKKSCGTIYITRGWRSFCRANRFRAGDSFTFKLIQGGRTLVLRFSSTEFEEEEGDEIESLSSEPESDEESNRDEKSFKKHRLRWKPSSSPSQNRFVTLTLTPSSVKRSRLYLPMPFTLINGIDGETKMSLLDKNGVNWSTSLRSENRGRRMTLVGGWKQFLKANSVKTNESIILELIREEGRSCVLKFCSKVKPETN